MPVSFPIIDLNALTPDQNRERQLIMRYIMWCTSVYGVAFMIHIKSCKENKLSRPRGHHKMCPLGFDGQKPILAKPLMKGGFDLSSLQHLRVFPN